MTKLLLNVFKLSPVVIAATMFVSSAAFAAEQNFTSVDELAQVTSVDQLSDVHSSHWAYQAVKSLTERYGCVAGYPDGTFRGNHKMTRYEFAALLNGCLDRITQLIAAGGNNTVSTVDVATINKLREEFQSELATLRGKVDGLEYRTEVLEANQFSTTTKLKGEAIFAVSGATGDLRADGRDNDGDGNVDNIDDNVVLSSRVRLNFDSSFTGKDRLRVRLQARNTPNFSKATGTNMARLGFEGSNDNKFDIGELNYTFKPSKNLTLKVDAVAGEASDNTDTYSMFSSSGGGAISRYGRFSPIYRVAEGDAGFTVRYGSKKSPIGVTAAYFTDNNNDFTGGNGLFSNNSAYFGQVDIKPSKKFKVGLTYVHTSQPDGVNVSGSTGSSIAKAPFGDVATEGNHYGVQASYKLSKKATLAGWYGISDVNRDDGIDGNATIQYWAASLGVKDFGAKGNTLGLIFGQSPRVSDASGFKFDGANNVAATADVNNSYHLEALYKMKVNDRIAVTPGLLVVFDPEHNSGNDTIYVGTVRTTFKF